MFFPPHFFSERSEKKPGGPERKGSFSQGLLQSRPCTPLNLKAQRSRGELPGDSLDGFRDRIPLPLSNNNHHVIYRGGACSSHTLCFFGRPQMAAPTSTRARFPCSHVSRELPIRTLLNGSRSAHKGRGSPRGAFAPRRRIKRPFPLLKSPGIHCKMRKIC